MTEIIDYLRIEADPDEPSESELPNRRLVGVRHANWWIGYEQRRHWFELRTGLECGTQRLLTGEELKMRRRLFFALVAASAVALALIATSAVAAATPFKGTVHAVEANQLVFPVLSVNRTGTGNATYLGRYTEHVTLQVNVTTRSSTGTATFTAANGDTLTASVVGQATPTTPGMISVVEVYTITGGTGRFVHTTGTFTLHSTANQATGVSSGTLSGSIVLH
jgi:hypothetical protein